MTIILPHEEISIDEVESELNAEVLDKVFEHEPIPLLPVHVYLPSFKLEYKAEVRYLLFFVKSKLIAYEYFLIIFS